MFSRKKITSPRPHPIHPGPTPSTPSTTWDPPAPRMAWIRCPWAAGKASSSATAKINGSKPCRNCCCCGTSLRPKLPRSDGGANSSSPRRAQGADLAGEIMDFNVLKKPCNIEIYRWFTWFFKSEQRIVSNVEVPVLSSHLHSFHLSFMSSISNVFHSSWQWTQYLQAFKSCSRKKKVILDQLIKEGFIMIGQQGAQTMLILTNELFMRNNRRQIRSPAKINQMSRQCATLVNRKIYHYLFAHNLFYPVISHVYECLVMWIYITSILAW